MDKDPDPPRKGSRSPCPLPARPTLHSGKGVLACACCLCATRVMDWGHFGLEGCDFAAKANSCAHVWGRCFIATADTVKSVKSIDPLSAYLCV